MSRDAVRFGRVPKREKAKILAAMQSSRQKTQESKVMGELNDDAKIIDCIVRAHYDTCDYTRKKMEPFLQGAKANPKYISCSGTTCPMKGRPEDSFIEQFSERFMDHVRQVCTFAKLIPGFKCLHHDDQVTLLKSCVFEVLLVRLAGLFDSQSLVCLNGDIIRKDTINAMAPGNAKFLMDSVFELTQRMNTFRLSDAEIGLFCAVVIITPDRPGLRNPELLMRIQNKLKMVLNSILLPQHPENESIFPELMTMIHDLRTLNTLHTEKFLQQCKINDHVPSMATVNDNFEVSAHQRWDSAHLDRDSTGNGSPQSSSGGDTHSSTSLEDTSSRRSPMGSVSSTDSSSSEVCKLLTNVQDLRMTANNNSSVLMTALTSQPLNQRKTPHLLTTTCPMQAGSTSTVVVSSMASYNKYKTSSSSTTSSRKTDSPGTDSGVDLQPQISTNNSSLCSSPQPRPCTGASPTPVVAAVAAAAAASSVNEERHPLLKRALQQPPQLFNNGVATFQDEVYKPHKKFRRHNSSFSKDDCPTSSTTQGSQRSQSPPEVTGGGHRSLLASQLAEPPLQYSSSSSTNSLLASTLSQGIPLASTEESKRNEILAQLILDGNKRRNQQQLQQQNQPQGLLMCAPTTSNAYWEQRTSTSSSSSESTVRHIPVATLPTKPTPANRCPMASSTVTSGELQQQSGSSLQPLNLSKRPLTASTKNAEEAGSAAAAAATSGQQDIPTKA